MLSLFKNLLEVLINYLRVKNLKYIYDITQESKEKQAALVNKIEMLRNAGDDHSNDVADVMRKQLLAEREHLEHISALGPQSLCVSPSANK